VEHVAEGQEKGRGLLKGVLEEVMGGTKISQSLNLEIGPITSSRRAVCLSPKPRT
jgi:hypothetical protein